MILDYIQHGWSLTPITPGTKSPAGIDWNTVQNSLIEPPAPGYGVGLMHAYSGTMALDVDNWERSVEFLNELDIDLLSLTNATDSVGITSGRHNSAKLLYRMPTRLVLPTKQIRQDKQTLFELRCGTVDGKSMQDILPPSVHPGTKLPYRWVGNGHWNALPEIPANLLEYWRSLIIMPTVASVEITASWVDIHATLELVPADVSRDEWIAIGMGLHHYGIMNDDLLVAFQIWNTWSARSTEKYPGEKAITAQWNSFKSDNHSKVTIGTLFHIASEYGWVRVPEPVDIAGMFKAVRRPMEPIKIQQGIRPMPPEVDLSLWPPILAVRAKELSEQVGCDPLVPLWSGLAAICGVADSRIRLELMRGFKVPPVLWLMTIGEPADKKTPGSSPMFTVLKDLELEDMPRFKKEMLHWEGKEAAYVAAKKNFLTSAASPEFVVGNEVLPDVPDLPPQPSPLKITVSDITSQKLVRIASERPRGLLCYLDEMNAWCRKMTDRNSGEDRSTWVVSYESTYYEMDRVQSGSVHCQNLAVSIFGNIQPRVFRECMASLSSDGLLQRFLPAVLRGDYTKRGEPLPEFMTHELAWEKVVRLTYSLPPATYKLSPEAFALYREFQLWYEETKRDERLLASSDSFMTAFGKIEGTAGRLMCLFHIIENPFSPTVSIDIAARVIHIIKTFIIPSLRYAMNEIGDSSSVESWITDHIIHNCDQESILLSDIKRSGRRPLADANVWRQDQLVIGAMQLLESMGWVQRADDGSKEHSHYAKWIINPELKELFTEYRNSVIRAKQKRVDEIYESRGWDKKLVKGAEELPPE